MKEPTTSVKLQTINAKTTAGIFDYNRWITWTSMN